MHIYLYGPPGSGKSTIGRILAERLAMPFVDLDSMIENEAQADISTIFRQRGEVFFRDLESAALQQVAAGAPAVVALGGGALLRDDNRRLAERSGEVLCLTADYATLARRVSTAPGKRPLLKEGAVDVAPLAKLLAARQAHYGSFRRRVIVSDIPAPKTADQAQCALGTYHIRGMGQGYYVQAGQKLLQGIGERLAAFDGSRRSVVVCDNHTAPLYGERVVELLCAAGMEATLAVIPAGEATKDIVTVQSLWDAFLKAGVERGSLVVALGGGVVGDLTGFAAATWLRGVRWVGLPTTLLAMVDSSMGGKTGADLPAGKNLIGAFHPPTLVLADTTTLQTLPACELRCGLAEVIKHAVIDDPGLLDELRHFDFCADLDEHEACAALAEAPWLDNFVARAMAVKARIIQQDPFEKGRRAALNLGHTIGHGIEKATNFAVRHGEAVAIGTVLEARVAEALGMAQTDLADQLANYFSSVGLPVTLPRDIDLTAVEQAMKLDKKRADGQVRFALPVALGDVRTGILVPQEVLTKTLTLL